MVTIERRTARRSTLGYEMLRLLTISRGVSDIGHSM